MDNTRIITYIKDGVLADALYEDGRMMELSLISKEQGSILGNIYIGKVKNIVKNIQIISNCSIKSCQIGYKSQKIKVSFQ